jgi:hypothetical protein
MEASGFCRSPLEILWVVRHFNSDAISPKASPKLTHESNGPVPPPTGPFSFAAAASVLFRHVMGGEHVVNELPRRVLPTETKGVSASRSAI